MAILLEEFAGARPICRVVDSTTTVVNHMYLSLPKPPLSPLIAPYCSQKIDFPERWPVGVTKVELAVGALPEHEARQTHLSTSADDQIGIGAVIGIQEFVQRLRGKFLEDFLM
jgi:hypothetical protein